MSRKSGETIDVARVISTGQDRKTGHAIVRLRSEDGRIPAPIEPATEVPHRLPRCLRGRGCVREELEVSLRTSEGPALGLPEGSGCQRHFFCHDRVLLAALLEAPGQARKQRTVRVAIP